MRGEAVGERFTAIAELLEAEATWWRPRPFAEPWCAWETAHPSVSRWLRNLPLAAAEAMQADPSMLEAAPAPLGTLAARTRSLARLPAWPTGTPRAVGGRRGMSPRKQAQVEALARVLDGAATPWVDWCAGKGYLGRTLASGGEVVFVERRRALLEEALRRARDEGVAARGVCCDVLEAVPEVPATHAMVALHACGALGDAAIRVALGGPARALEFVPCCPHAHRADRLPLRSTRGQATGLELGVRALRFATAEEVSVAPGRRARRRQEQAFRLGVDALLREATGEDRYRPLGSAPARWVRGGFRGFAEAIAAREGLPLPARWDAERAERAGWERLGDVRRRTLARLPFRRLAELFVILDRACWLLDAGWQVEVGTFCPPTVTPRNVLVRARPRARPSRSS